MELAGVIKKVRLGNPHGILEVEVRGEMWVIEVGQPWRNERAGLKDGDLSEGLKSGSLVGRQPTSPTGATSAKYNTGDQDCP